MARRRCLGRCGRLITRGSYCSACKPYQGSQWANLRHRILERDDHQCRCDGCGSCAWPGPAGINCARRATTADHIVPRSFGGTDDPSNLVAMCRQCNSAKRGR